MTEEQIRAIVREEIEHARLSGQAITFCIDVDDRAAVTGLVPRTVAEAVSGVMRDHAARYC